MNKKNDIKRINIRLPEYIQDWYKEQGKKYSVPYSNYMAMLLTEIYEKDREKEIVQELNQTMKQLKEMSGDVTAKEMKKQVEQLKEMVREIENKQPTGTVD